MWITASLFQEAYYEIERSTVEDSTSDITAASDGKINCCKSPIPARRFDCYIYTMLVVRKKL